MGTESVISGYGNGVSSGCGNGEMARQQNKERTSSSSSSCGMSFQMPLHYPRYTKAEYQNMPEWKIDILLQEYGLPVTGDINYKRNFAMGAFLWSQ
ncbi:hypothetical protein MKW94_005789 [Papaver nudicaule]|uniref:DUF7722 domain-containing protein n=1 Tax=Papaver nudicaule TaxID=74823 RepID=A0AA41S513_PAPNU|nr:hypothetical protein [Papaver nudicaule]